MSSARRLVAVDRGKAVPAQGGETDGVAQALARDDLAHEPREGMADVLGAAGQVAPGVVDEDVVVAHDRLREHDELAVP